MLRHLHFAAVIYGLHFESEGTCLLVNNTHVKSCLYTVRKEPDFTFPKGFFFGGTENLSSVKKDVKNEQ